MLRSRLLATLVLPAMVPLWLVARSPASSDQSPATPRAPRGQDTPHRGTAMRQPIPMRPVTPPLAPFEVEEGPEAVVVRAGVYSLAALRETFAFTLRRGGDVVLESAQPGDGDMSLAFSRQGKSQAVTGLRRIAREADGIVLEYDTTASGVVARVHLRPSASSVRVTTWLLTTDGDLAASVRVRLASAGAWFGGGFQGWKSMQTFPLNEARLVKDAFYGQGNTQGTPCWYATKGIALWVQNPDDFAYAINRHVRNGRPDGLLSIEMPGVAGLSYDLVVGSDIADVVRQVVKRIGYPAVVPPAEYFTQPIYTTWVEHKVPVSQAKVLEFATAIRTHKLPAGVLEIDDKWEAHYGDAEFDRVKFPDPKAMVDLLHAMGFKVTLWITPFVNTDSRTYAAHRRDGLLLRDRLGDAGLVQWWNGTAAVWDFSNPRAAAAFRGQLAALQRRYAIDGFKFDGGDVNMTPRDSRSSGNIVPAEYADVYNREATARFTLNETRVGIYSQPLGVVQRLIDKHSQWGAANGLAALVAEATTVSLRGFQYVMPDMVGGNEYDGDKIDKELLVRWAQASALMPLLQFSKGPWHYDEEAVRLCREASELHIAYAPTIVALARRAPATGEPIIAPLWYHFPRDPETYRTNEQFMLGTDIVVAPVVMQGKRSRDVYLPSGQWKDRKTGQVHRQGWIRAYPAPLDTLPVFERVK